MFAITVRWSGWLPFPRGVLRLSLTPMRQLGFAFTPPSPSAPTRGERFIVYWPGPPAHYISAGPTGISSSVASARPFTRVEADDVSASLEGTKVAPYRGGP